MRREQGTDLGELFGNGDEEKRRMISTGPGKEGQRELHTFIADSAIAVCISFTNHFVDFLVSELLACGEDIPGELRRTQSIEPTATYQGPS